MTKDQLTTAQLDILTVAAAHAEGRVEYFPASVRGGARKRVLNSLEQQSFIEYRDALPYITQLARHVLHDTQAAVEHCNAALDAMQAERDAAAADMPSNAIAEAAPTVETSPTLPEPQASPMEEAAVPGSGVATAEALPEGTPAVTQTDAALGEAAAPVNGWVPKPGTKQAILLDALRTEAGVDVETLMAATGWQKHSVRGAISTLSGMPGISITKTKVDGTILYRCN